MNPPIRHASSIVHATTAGVLVLTTVLLALLLTRPGGDPPIQSTASPDRASPSSTADLTPLGRIIRPSAEPGTSGGLARRFRLAGTVLGVSNVGADEPLAIIDDRETVSQKIVRRHTDVVPGVRLTQVRADAVVLSGPAGEEELFLEKAGGSGRATGPDTPAADSGDASADAADRFGDGAVFPGRWQFNRDALLGYYAELRDEPQRLLAIFDSMEPVYETDPEGRQVINGYVVNVRGEGDFFEAAGLRNGDVVRSVNSVTMTNRRRAEAFIKSFVEGNASTFVLDIERDGADDKHVYVIE